jgi:hypothetical protein
MKHETEVGPFPMDSGEYYVGDLQHVFDCATWNEVVTLFPDASKDMQGKVTLASGRVICMFDLPSNGFRRRDYMDIQGRCYYMNSSLMGITLAHGLEAEYKDDNLRTCAREKGEDFQDMMARMGNVVQYKEKFECNSIVSVLKGGHIMGRDCDIAMIRFGDNVCIDTDESQDDSSDSGKEDGDAFFMTAAKRMADAVAYDKKEAARKAGSDKAAKPAAAIAKPIKKNTKTKTKTKTKNKK